MSTVTADSFEISDFSLFRSIDILSAVLDRSASFLLNLVSKVFSSDETFFRSLLIDEDFFSISDIELLNPLLSVFLADLMYFIAVVASSDFVCKEEV